MEEWAFVCLFIGTYSVDFFFVFCVCSNTPCPEEKTPSIFTISSIMVLYLQFVTEIFLSWLVLQWQSTVRMYHLVKQWYIIIAHCIVVKLYLPSLELRRLYHDLIYCYKIICGMVDLTTSDFFQWAPCTSTRGHSFKLYKNSCSPRVRSTFFSERIVNVWNGLPANVEFSSLRSFTRTVKLADLSLFLKCYN